MRITMQLGAICLLTSLWACTGYAQATEDSVLREEYVSARKRTEPMQSSPESANTILKHDIEEFVRGDLEQLESIAPNLVIDSIDGTPQGAAITIRGIGSGDAEKSFDPSVGLFIDGVYVGNHTSRMQDVFDFERVTVLRGPQGALHGRNTAGGAILIERTRPTGKPGVLILLQAASYDRQQLSGVFNAPLIKDQLAGKFTVNSIENGGGYMDSCTLDVELHYDCRKSRDENSRDYLSLSGSLMWTPTADLSLYYIYQNEVEDSNTRALLNFSASSDLLCINSEDNTIEDEFCQPANLGLTVPQTLNTNIVDQDFTNESNLEGDYHTLELDWKFGAHQLTSLAATRNQDELVNQDLDAASARFFSTIREQDYRQSSWETRLLSQLSDKLESLVGTYYIKSKYSLQQENPFLPASLATAGIIPGAVPANLSQYQITEQTKSSISLFGHVSYVLNEKWTADLGARYSRDRVSIRHRPGGTKLGDVITLPAPLSDNQQWNDLLARVGLWYKIDDSAMLYTLYSQGDRGGGFNERAVSSKSLRDYDPEKVSNYELGLKTQWLDDRLRINVSGFQLKSRDKQETIFKIVDDAGNQESVTEDFGRASVSGFEMDIRAVPIERLQLRATYGHLSTDFTRYRVPSRETPEAFDGIEGMELLRAPENTFSLSASYYWYWAEGRIEANTTYHWISDYFTTRSNVTVGAFEIGEDGNVVTDLNGDPVYLPPVREPIVIGNVNGRGLWNVSIAYLWQDWTFRAFSRNLNNKRYLQNAASISSDFVVSTAPNELPTPLLTNSEYNEPRFSGIEVTYHPDF